MERALQKQFQSSCNGPILYSNSNLYPCERRRAGKYNYMMEGSGRGGSNSKCFLGASKHYQQQTKVYGSRRRRRGNESSDTFVIMEPGEDERFVSKEELEAIITGWLQNWPGPLPPDLSRFQSTQDAVSFLVKSVCELEIDGDVGSIQWYQVRLD